MYRPDTDFLQTTDQIHKTEVNTEDPNGRSNSVCQLLDRDARPRNDVVRACLNPPQKALERTEWNITCHMCWN